MANTYTAITTVTVGSGGASNIQFTNIPGTYTDLLIKYSLRSLRQNSNYDIAVMQFNSNSSNMSQITMQGGSTNNTTGSFTTSGNTHFDVNAAAETDTFTSIDVYISNYTSSNNKSVSIENVTEQNSSGGNSAYVNFAAIRWSNASAITSITMTANNGNWSQYSTATLYGISAVV